MRSVIRTRRALALVVAVLAVALAGTSLTGQAPASRPRRPPIPRCASRGSSSTRRMKASSPFKGDDVAVPGADQHLRAA